MTDGLKEPGESLSKRFVSALEEARSGCASDMHAYYNRPRAYEKALEAIAKRHSVPFDRLERLLLFRIEYESGNDPGGPGR